jgi:hypothetical protein
MLNSLDGAPWRGEGDDGARRKALRDDSTAERMMSRIMMVDLGFAFYYLFTYPRKSESVEGERVKKSGKEKRESEATVRP